MRLERLNADKIGGVHGRSFARTFVLQMER